MVLYAVMPYNWSHPTSCSALSNSPNNDFGADAEVNTLTHELEETNTDPQLNAWYDSVGNENADKCAWTFGTTTPRRTGPSPTSRSALATGSSSSNGSTPTVARA